MAFGCVAAIAVIVTLWLASHASMDYLSNDAAQYVSTARNLARGNGFTTSILYYEQQHRYGQLAPQTSWPPAFPAAVALAAEAGVAPERGVWVIACLAFLGVAALSYFCVRACGGGTIAAAAAAIAWLFAAENWLSVLRGLSEPLFIFMTMLSALLLMRSADRERPYLWFTLAGIAAGLAFLSRYAAVAYVPAGALVAAITGLHGSLRSSWREALKRGLIFATPACVLVAAGFIRNLMLSGSLTGGPRIDAGATLGSTLHYLDWSIRRLITGPTDARLPELAVLVLFVCGAAVMAVAALDWIRNRLRQAHPPALEIAERDVVYWITLACGYTGATLVLLAYIGVTTEAAILTERYVLPVLPFALVAVALFADRIVATRRDVLGRATGVFAIAMAIAFASSQIYAGTKAVRDLPTTSDGAVIGPILRARIGSDSIAELIRREIPPGASVFETNGQLIGLHLDVPSVGLPSAYYSSKVWDERAVRELVSQTGVAALCIFPRLHIDAEVNVNRVFIQQLIDGARPAWLVPVIQRDDFLLFRVRDFDAPPARPER